MDARDELPESLMNACLILEALDELRKLYNYRVTECVRVDMNLEIRVCNLRCDVLSTNTTGNGQLAWL